MWSSTASWKKTACAALAFEEFVHDQLMAQRQLWAHTSQKRRSESWAQMRGRKASDNTLEKRRKLSALREEQTVENMKCPATSDLQAEHRLHDVRGAASDGEASELKKHAMFMITTSLNDASKDCNNIITKSATAGCAGAACWPRVATGRGPVNNCCSEFERTTRLRQNENHFYN